MGGPSCRTLFPMTPGIFERRPRKSCKRGWEESQPLLQLARTAGHFQPSPIPPPFLRKLPLGSAATLYPPTAVRATTTPLRTMVKQFLRKAQKQVDSKDHAGENSLSCRNSSGIGYLPFLATVYVNDVRWVSPSYLPLALRKVKPLPAPK